MQQSYIYIYDYLSSGSAHVYFPVVKEDLRHSVYIAWVNL